MSETSAPAPVAVDILVEDSRWSEEPDLGALVETAVAAAAARADAQIAPGSEVSVVLTDDARIRVLNREHRGVDKATNVLSFPQDDPDADVYGPLLGDIVMARETVAREALDGGLPFRHHLTHMVVHGMLHLVGYDHRDDDEAEEMERLETAILAALDIPDPYAEPPIPGGGH
ncbi:MAG TPA: rRNA maturation RNase YbeY [Methylomirabilota bacterium]|nr:rRNA maturation RNase YbeY [Methylomirabilota bacterium]